MKRESRITVSCLALLGASLAWVVVAGHAQSSFAPAQGQMAASQGGTQAAPAAAVKKAPEVFKNIQVLKDLDADKLQPAMQFIAASLGVECSFCHVQEAGPDGRPRLVYEKDDKREKTTARHMMQMTMDINKNSFNGNRQITCNTCHRGSSSPVGIPAVLDTEGERPQTPPNAAPPAAPPTADKIFANYLDALGGADAVAKITTRVEKGNVLAGPTPTPIDLYMKAPDKRISFSHGPNGDSITAFDGTAGWLGGGRGGSRDMSSTDAMSARVDAAVAFPASLKTIFPQFRPGRPEKIGDKDMYVLTGRGPNAPLTRFYFDEQTGLLMRVIRYNDAGLGFMPVQVDYSDYRPVDGVKIPFRWTLSRPNGRFSIQIDSVQQNVAIDDSKFMKPAAPAGNPPGQR